MASVNGRHARHWALAGRSNRYAPKPRDDSPDALLGLAECYPRYGVGKLFAVLRRHGFRWNHKRVYRIYCLLKMNHRRKRKKRLPSRNPQPLAVPPCANVFQVFDGIEGNYAELAEAVQRGAGPRASRRFDPGRVPHENFTQGHLYCWMVLTWGGLQAHCCVHCSASPRPRAWSMPVQG